MAFGSSGTGLGITPVRYVHSSLSSRGNGGGFGGFFLLPCPADMHSQRQRRVSGGSRDNLWTGFEYCDSEILKAPENLLQYTILMSVHRIRLTHSLTQLFDSA
eukprot:TRINITY_DN5361_c0_g1_i1.p2 TRINITY_DN5361_c0_g1~~TRINITY_DN5361_c0_g1_i1.p2  ORF type:complete len:103 (+),score=4.88 TRINITY_DN5361_c0_g1_i1:88-396(+)